MSSLNLDDGAMQQVITKAIIDTLTPEKREQLIAQAVKSLLEKTDGSRYTSRTRLQEAFDLAVYNVAQQVAMKELTEDAGLRDKVRALMLASWTKLTEGEGYEKLVGDIANSMRRAITGERF